MSKAIRQSNIFGKRSEPHTIIIARGEDFRHFTIRPWMAAVAGSLAAAFAIGYLLATSYLVLRDDLIGASIARQARMQHAYEDRIAALRSQMDRVVSRQLLDQQEMEAKVAELVARQDVLAERHDRITPLLDRMDTGSVAVPVPGTNPRAKSDQAMINAKPSLREAPDGRTGHVAADMADRTFADISTSLADIEKAQMARMALITDEAVRTAERIESALAKAGLPVPTVQTDAGGPFISAEDAGADGLLFEQTVRNLDDALERLDAVRDGARSAPIAFPVADPRISSHFGLRKDPILGSQAFHSGTDFKAPTGTKVLATGRGKVVAAGWNGGYGRMVEIRHPSGLVTRYAHLSAIDVAEGDRIEPGDVVGRVGSSGRSTGPHLHYEVRRGEKPLDPGRFLNAGKGLAGFL